MKLTLKALKINSRMSEETTCFSATLLADGVPVAEVANRGTGGPHEFHWKKGADRAAVEAFAAAQPTEFDFEKLDQLVDKLMAAEAERKQFVRWCKTKTVFQLKGDNPDAFRTINSPFTPMVRAHLANKHGDRLLRIVNEELAADAA